MSALEHDELVSLVREATENVFEMMLGQSIISESAYLDTVVTPSSNGVVSFIGLAGAWIGTGSISCTAACACQIASQLLMGEYAAVCLARAELRAQQREQRQVRGARADEERRDADIRRLCSQVAEQRLGQAAVPERLIDAQRHLGTRPVDPRVGRPADGAAAEIVRRHARVVVLSERACGARADAPQPHGSPVAQAAQLARPPRDERRGRAMRHGLRAWHRGRGTQRGGGRRSSRADPTGSPRSPTS